MFTTTTSGLLIPVNVQDEINAEQREIATLKARLAQLTGTTIQPRRVGSSAPRPRVGSGLRFRELIAQGHSDAECVAIVRNEFPTSRATVSDARWNRNALRKGKFAIN